MQYNDIIDRLQNLTNTQVAQVDLCKILGIKSAAMSNRASRNGTFKTEEIDKLNSYYGVNLYTNNTQLSKSDDCIPVTYRPDVYLSAGYGIEVLDESKETMLIDKRLLVTDRGNRINPNNCEIVRISGNSMSPEYRHGDRVIIDKGDTELVDGHIFAFRYKNACYVKEINLLGDKIKCISLNKEYDPFYIESSDEFRVLGRIIPRVRL